MARRRLCVEGCILPEIACVSGPLSGGVARLRLYPTGCFPSVIVWAYCAPEGVGATSAAVGGFRGWKGRVPSAVDSTPPGAPPKYLDPGPQGNDL